MEWELLNTMMLSKAGLGSVLTPLTLPPGTLTQQLLALCADSSAMREGDHTHRGIELYVLHMG